MLEFTASGQVKGAVEVDAHAVLEATEADLVETGVALTAAYENGVLSTVVDEYTVDADAIAYKWDVVELEFTKKTVSKSNLAIGVTVDLYDLDEDGVLDIILYR
jgi:predicted SnoaL-like aldol condensation-catalyzing enzyme